MNGHRPGGFLKFLPAVICLLLLLSSALTAEDLVNLKFLGKYRKSSKTSIVRNSDGTISPAVNHKTVKALLKMLGPDSVMRAKYPDLDSKTSNALRATEELRNVEIVAWIYDVKKQSDNDFHVVIGSSATRSKAVFINTEIAGLPVAPGEDRDTLKAARQEFIDIVPGGSFSTESSGSPIKVRIRGSVLFDGDHVPGGATSPGPAYAKPKTVWEIHPVFRIEKIGS
jgi:hypothetical protein